MAYTLGASLSQIIRELRERQGGPTKTLVVDGISARRLVMLWQAGYFDQISGPLLGVGPPLPPEPAALVARMNDTVVIEQLRARRGRFPEINPDDVDPGLPVIVERKRRFLDPEQWR